MPTSSRDQRNWRKGYQEALVDLANAISEGGLDAGLDWIANNGDEATRDHFDSLMLRGEAIGAVSEG